MQVKSHPLTAGGELVNVTNGNRVEYVGLYVRWVLETSIALQVLGFGNQGIRVF